MAPSILPQIDASMVGYTPTGSNFAELVAAMLGNTADVSDGWDQDLEAVIATFPQTDAALADLDATAELIDSGVTAFSALDVAGTIGGMFSTPPPLGLDISGPVLNPVGGPSLPIPPTAPAPPPTVCIPQAPPIQPRPPAPGRRVPPPPLPPTPACPPGQYFSPTMQTCTPNDQPPPPSPDPPGGNPFPLPVPPLSPCPSGFVYDPSVQDCVQQPSGGATPGYTFIGGVLFPQTGEQAAASLATVLSVTLGLPVWLIQAIPIFGQVVGAFLTFNQLFGGNWDAELAAYAAEMRTWAASAPVAFTAYVVQTQIQDLLGGRGVGGELITTPELQQQMLAELQTEYDALQACMTAGEFNSCPPYI